MADEPVPGGRARMKRKFIPGLEAPLSELVLGGMVLSPDDLDFAAEMLDLFVSLGGNAVDTARIYGGGNSERALGEWMRIRRNRDEVVVVGKGAHHDAGGRRVYPEAISADLEASLEALQTDYIDLYLLHRDDPSRPVGEIVECLCAHQDAGRIRAFGASNWRAARIEEANGYAARHALSPFVCSSVNFSLASMQEPPWEECVSAAGDELSWYRSTRFPLLAWSSQAQGFFTGRYSAEDLSQPEMVRVWYSPENFERLRRAEALGRRYAVPATAIALAYVLAQPFPVFALIGPRTSEELLSSARALQVSLTEEDISYLESG
jgi:aryl-alcohol dehydrogenase-like predicted oxidoreductase